MTPDARDALLTLSLVGSFAALITVHVTTLFGLVSQRHFKAALGSFLLPPLAPICAFREGMPARGATWIVSAAVYLAAFVLVR
jgi:hypothetical protein